jgi:exopolysaccharide production protein ExoY
MSHILVDECWTAAGVPAARAPVRPATAAAVRAIDLTCAVLALIAFSPLMLLLAAMIFVIDGGPVLYTHHRRGLDGKRFPCLKFRTMRRDSAAQLRHLLENSAEARAEWARDHKLRNDPRVLPLGAFLRRMSLDELPQLLNVLRGEMSIVGPRPIVDEEVLRYGRYYSAYCSVKPGLTGLWQISGRSDTNYGKRVALDILYVKRRSVLFYMVIVLKTPLMVVGAKGSY